MGTRLSLPYQCQLMNGTCLELPVLRWLFNLSKRKLSPKAQVSDDLGFFFLAAKNGLF